MLNIIYKSKIRTIAFSVTFLLGITLLVQGIIGINYSYKSKMSAHQMTTLIIDNDMYNLSALLSQVDSLISLIETDGQYLFNFPAQVTNDIAADSKAFNELSNNLKTLIQTNITDISFNNAFLFLSDNVPISYMAPYYLHPFNTAAHPNSIGLYSASSIKDTEWFKPMHNTVEANIWVEKKSGRDILCYAKNMYTQTLQRHDVISQHIGIFFVSFDLSHLLSQSKLRSIYPQASTTLSHNGTVIYSNRSDNTEKNIEDFTYTSSLYPGLKLISVVPKQNINASYRMQLFTTIIMLIILFLVSCIFFLYVNHAIISPLEKMTYYLEGKKKIPLTSAQKLVPEIEVLYQSHNTMLDKIDEAMLESRKSYYKMLQAQINPHFTYNVLNSISAFSLMNGDFRIPEIISNLVEMLRYGINDPETLVPLSMELDISERFVRIQNFRSEKKIIIEYDVPEDLLAMKMPKLTLQPLIENSIFHCDYDSHSGDIHIKVSAYSKNDQAFIVICDTNHADVNALNRHLLNNDMYDKSNRRGLGIYNIHQRLLFMFGDEYGLHYKADNSGLCTIITLPRN